MQRTGEAAKRAGIEEVVGHQQPGGAGRV